MLFAGIVITYKLLTNDDHEKAIDDEPGYTKEDKIRETGKYYHKELVNMYETVNYKPYCGIEDELLDDVEFTDFNVKPGSGQELMYYKSDYKGLKELREYYKEYLSDEYVDKIFERKKAVSTKDLRNHPESDFVSYKGILYCRFHITKKPKKILYDSKIVINNYKSNIVNYTLTENYVNSDNICIKKDNCSSNDYITKNSILRLEKKHGKWVVTYYYLLER